jgi:hypothetical protein
MTLKIARTRHARLVFIKCGLRVGNFQPAKVRGGAKKGGNPRRPAPSTPLLQTIAEICNYHFKIIILLRILSMDSYNEPR